MAEIHLKGVRAINEAALDALARHTGRTEEPYLVAEIFRDPRFRASIVNAVDYRWNVIHVHTVLVHKKRWIPPHCPLSSRLSCRTPTGHARRHRTAPLLISHTRSCGTNPRI